jgi:hypothetical protein
MTGHNDLLGNNRRLGRAAAEVEILADGSRHSVTEGRRCGGEANIPATRYPGGRAKHNYCFDFGSGLLSVRGMNVAGGAGGCLGFLGFFGSRFPRI